MPFPQIIHHDIELNTLLVNLQKCFYDYFNVSKVMTHEQVTFTVGLRLYKTGCEF